MKTRLIAMSALALILQGCGKEIVYVPVPCPKLQTYEVNTTVAPMEIKYEVRDNG